MRRHTAALLCASLLALGGCGADEPVGWTKRAAVAGTNPLDGSKLWSVSVDITSDWGKERADEITGDLWVEYGSVRVEFYCTGNDALLARTMQTQVSDFQGTAWSANTCP